MKFLSALLSMVGLGGSAKRKPISLVDPPFEERAREERAQALIYNQVYRGGRHQTRGAAECPICLTTSAKAGQCLNRACKAFNGRLAKTHPDLLSLDRKTRLAAQDRWAGGVSLVAA